MGLRSMTRAMFVVCLLTQGLLAQASQGSASQSGASQAEGAGSASGALNPAQTPASAAPQGPAAGTLKWTESSATGAGAAPGPTASTFAVITRKGGVASALAHNHFIYAKGYSMQVEPGDGPTQPRSARVVFDVEGLVIDDPAVIEAAGRRLQELGIAHAQFSALSDSDRKNIREHMLAEGQLWAEKFPRIEVIATGFRSREAKIGALDANAEADFEFRIRGQSVKKVVPLMIKSSASAKGSGQSQSSASGHVTVEGLVAARFTEFGFKPYSGLLGAVRNEDEFHFYIRTEGLWTP